MSSFVSSLKQSVQNTGHLLLGILLITATAACSKPEARLSIRSAESQKDLPSTALVRKIEIQYHDAAGDEHYRQSVPVYGMGQPISLQNDSLKKLEWDSTGSFTASAYTGDGLLLLRGVGRGNPDSEDPVEIVLERDTGDFGLDSGTAATRASVVLRQIRLLNVPSLEGYSISSKELRDPERHSVADSCLVVPRPILLEADRGAWPAFRIETSIKAPAYFYSVLAPGQDPASAPKVSVDLGPLGDPEVELNPAFLSKNQMVPNEPRQLHLWGPSREYEGCIQFAARVQLKPLMAQLIPGGPATGPGIFPDACLVVNNDNEVDVDSLVTVTASLKNGQGAAIFWNTSNDAVHDFDQLRTMRNSSHRILIKAHSSAGYCFFGGFPIWRPTPFDTEQHLKYRVSVSVVNSPGQSLPVLNLTHGQ